MGVRPITKDSSQQMAIMTFALRPVTRLLYLRRFNKLFELEHERNIKRTSEEHQRNIRKTSEEHLRNGLITIIIINSSSNIFVFLVSFPSVFLETPGRWRHKTAARISSSGWSDQAETSWTSSHSEDTHRTSAKPVCTSSNVVSPLWTVGDVTPELSNGQRFFCRLTCWLTAADPAGLTSLRSADSRLVSAEPEDLLELLAEGGCLISSGWCLPGVDGFIKPIYEL